MANRKRRHSESSVASSASGASSPENSIPSATELTLPCHIFHITGQLAENCRTVTVTINENRVGY